MSDMAKRLRPGFNCNEYYTKGTLAATLSSKFCRLGWRSSGRRCASCTARSSVCVFGNAQGLHARYIALGRSRGDAKCRPRVSISQVKSSCAEKVSNVIGSIECDAPRSSKEPNVLENLATWRVAWLDVCVHARPLRTCVPKTLQCSARGDDAYLSPSRTWSCVEIHVESRSAAP